MALKRRGILARPGTYRYGDKTEVKTAEELKKAAERQPIIALTLGHPSGGIPKASDFIGTVNQKWNEQRQRVDAEFWFYDEVPEEVRSRIVNQWPTPISAGFTVESVENGTQKGIFYTHIAVLKDSEDPKCPLGQCGINVRMESNLTEDNYRYEQATEPIDPETTDATKKTVPKIEPFDPVGLGIVIGGLKAEIAQLREQLSKLNQPVPQKQEETVVEEATENITTPEPPRPKTIIPQGKSREKEGPDEDGFYRITVG
jgi:hypothetical protein